MSEFALGLLSGAISGAIVGGVFYLLSGRELRREAGQLREETRKARQVVNALAGWLKFNGVAEVKLDQTGDVQSIVVASGYLKQGPATLRAEAPLTPPSPTARGALVQAEARLEGQAAAGTPPSDSTA